MYGRLKVWENQMTRENSLIKREKRYLLLMPEYIMGGAETQFRYLIDYAEKNKWKLDVIIEHRVKKVIEPLPESLKKMKNVTIYEFDWRRANNKKMFLDVAVYVLRKMSHIQYRACLIYYTDDLIFAAELRILNIHVIYSERNTSSIIYHNLLFQKCLWYCDRILANSVFARKELMWLTGRKVGLIRNGKPVVSQLPIKSNRGINRILFPANITSIKNHMLLLQYLKVYPDFQGKLVFAGFTLDKLYKNKLMQFIKKNNLQDKVEFLGYVGDLKEEYRKADLVILPSLAEGTPNVVLEAYAYGRPVIVSDIEVERDVVRNPRLRFGVRSVAELNECIQYVQGLSDEAYMHMLAGNRQFVLQNYNIERMAEALYKELTEGKRYGLCKLGIMRLFHFFKSYAMRKEREK